MQQSLTNESRLYSTNWGLNQARIVAYFSLQYQYQLWEPLSRLISKTELANSRFQEENDSTDGGSTGRIASGLSR